MKKSDHASEKTEFSSFPEVLTFRARYQPEQTAYTFLQGKQRVQITYEQLFYRVTRQATFLKENEMTGKQALLLYPPMGSA